MSKTEHTHRHSHEKEVTLVSYVMDMSGSMHSVADATVSGYNEFVGNLKKDDNEYLLGLTRFNTGETIVQEPIAIDMIETLTTNEYRPNHMTPLIDAAYAAIKAAEKVAKKYDGDVRVQIVIQTDGMENASQHTTHQLNTLIKSKMKKDWQFLFLGADQDAWAQAAGWGIDKQHTISCTNKPENVRAVFAAASCGTQSYATADSAAAGGIAVLDSLDCSVGVSRDLRDDDDDVDKQINKAKKEEGK